MISLRRFFPIAVVLLSLPVAVWALRFTDVPLDDPHREAIEELAGLGVISGNPDGTFRHNAEVNRAAFLKMVYLGAGLTPTDDAIGCFPLDKEFQRGSWYEKFVCDAAKRGFVRGYPDGLFRAGNSVSRVEAIKMLVNVFGFSLNDISDAQLSRLPYTDVSASAWYSVPLAVAFEKGVLPIPGQDGPKFFPDRPLLRGEAATYIRNARRMRAGESEPALETESTPASSSAAPASSVSSVGQSASSASSAKIISIAVPFAGGQQFSKKSPVAYRFSIVKKTIVAITVSLAAGDAGEVSCRLYKFTSVPVGSAEDISGFSIEYYLGYQEGTRCFLTVALTPGLHQVEVSPTVADTHYMVEAAVVAGDGNDGFSQVLSLDRGRPITDVLGDNDFEDFFVFRVSSEKSMTVEFSSSHKLRCLIFPLEDVDLFGFSGPKCKVPYVFPVGTYVVGIGRAYPRSTRQTYSVQLR